jgi:aspartyl-tRNA synthetase
MLISGKHSIRDVIAFPLLRPERGTLEKVLEGTYNDEDEK